MSRTIVTPTVLAERKRWGGKVAQLIARARIMGYKMTEIGYVVANDPQFVRKFEKGHVFKLDTLIAFTDRFDRLALPHQQESVLL
jgi:hypothetical protein